MRTSAQILPFPSRPSPPYFSLPRPFTIHGSLTKIIQMEEDTSKEQKPGLHPVRVSKASPENTSQREPLLESAFATCKEEDREERPHVVAWKKCLALEEP